MNQVEMTVAMKKHYGAKWISAKNCFRFSKNDRSFELSVGYGLSSTLDSLWVDRLYLSERVMPQDDLGRIIVKPIASIEEKPGNIQEIRKWINRQLIAAFLDEYCVISEETPSSSS